MVANSSVAFSRFRFAVQLFFTLLCIWIGVEFYFFVQFIASEGQTLSVARPPGAEAFLPISSMMSLRYTISTGDIHPYHPAGLFLFIAILLISLVLGKSFCGWICPFGLLSELLGRWTQKTPLAKLSISRWIDYPLRSLKYLLLAFFVRIIFFMPLMGLKSFLDSEYNLVADLKMYLFFADLSFLAGIILCILLVLSIIIPRFWCRYLCPYGALLGLLALISPNRIKRNTDSCIDCGKCARVCPSRIKVDMEEMVISDECVSCLECVSACPVEDTLQIKTIGVKNRMSKWTAATVILVIFFGVCAVARVTGNWHNDVPDPVYHRLYQKLEYLDHPRSADEMLQDSQRATRH